MATPIDEATELLQEMIRNQCVNDGRPESGGEVKNAKTLGAYLAGPGMDIKQYESHPGRGSMSLRIESSERSGMTAVAFSIRLEIASAHRHPSVTCRSMKTGSCALFSSRSMNDNSCSSGSRCRL